MFKNKNKKSGFTLIELLVVIAIIGILSSVVLASLNSARRKSRDARRVADLGQIRLALELYFDANRAYPATLPSTLATTGCGGSPCIASVPNDPLNSAVYSYSGLGSGATCSGYHLGASLEESTNPALNNDVDAASSDAVCTGSVANFAGADAGKCNAADSGAYCYDLKP